jgi:hypothetical protein
VKRFQLSPRSLPERSGIIGIGKVGCAIALAAAGAHEYRSAAGQTESEARMSERLETLKKARERMIDDRDAFAKVLAAPFDRDKAERARMKFIETQALIDAIDRAIAGEQNRPGPAA